MVSEPNQSADGCIGGVLAILAFGLMVMMLMSVAKNTVLRLERIEKVLKFPDCPMKTMWPWKDIPPCPVAIPISRTAEKVNCDLTLPPPEGDGHTMIVTKTDRTRNGCEVSIPTQH